MSLLVISIWVVCFFDALILLCLPTTAKVNFATDGSTARYAVDFVCVAIGLLILFQNGWSKLPTRSMGLLLLAILISHFHAPDLHFDSTFMPKDTAIYDYKPLFEIFIFFMFFMGVYSSPITKESLRLLRLTFIWIPTVYAAFMILQRIGLDQFYTLTRDLDYCHLSRNPEVGGFICQPVFAAALLAILMPFVIRYGKIWQVILCSIAILSTGNRSALFVITICSFYTSQYRWVAKALIFGYLIYLITGIFSQMFPDIIHCKFFLEERFIVWKQVISDFTLPAFPGINKAYILTGTGIGSFPVIFPFYHHSGYLQAHNEFLEGLRCLGIIGAGLLLFCLKNIPRENKVLTTSILASCLLACTNAIWHVPQLAFITVLLIGLAYNKSIGEGYETAS